MSWRPEHINFGIIKVDGRRVLVYYDKLNYDSFTVNEDIKDVRWGGNDVLVYLTNGKVRRYYSRDNYNTV